MLGLRYWSESRRIENQRETKEVFGMISPPNLEFYYQNLAETTAEGGGKDDKRHPTRQSCYGQIEKIGNAKSAVRGKIHACVSQFLRHSVA